MIPTLLALLTLWLSPPAQATPPAQAAQGTTEPADIPVVVPRIVARYPHDRTAFTEGLLWHDGVLVESTGQEGRSEVRRVRLNDGRILARATIPAAQFGEGVALAGNDLVSLTWHDGIAHRWNAKTLKPLGNMRYTGEGWGLTGDATQLIRSDGSDTLRVVEPKTLKDRRLIAVTIRGRPLKDLNELELVDGTILANVWHTPYLVRIDPGSGKVVQIVDLKPIVAEIGATDIEAVANGIAWDAKARRLFVTGKLWPTLFEIALP